VARGAEIDVSKEVARAGQELQLARTYKYKKADDGKEYFFHAVGGGEGKKEKLKLAPTYSDLLKSYRTPLSRAQDTLMRTPRDLFQSAVMRLTSVMKTQPSRETARLLRDAVSEHIEGESLLGNDALINALRSRFPKVNKEGKPEESLEPPELLRASSKYFQSALDALEVLSTHPRLLRDGSDARGPNPFGFVKNSKGDEVLNELYIAMGAVERKVRVGVEQGKMMFNESAAGRQSVKDDAVQAARTEAAEQLKQAGQEGYLWLATLGALHGDQTSLSRNGAGEVRTQLGTADRVYQMIRRGENPDGYVKDFIPSRPVDRLYTDAVNAVVEANNDENSARKATREYDDSLQVLRRELGSQREAFRKPLEQLTGLKILDDGSVFRDQNALDFKISTAEGRERFMQYVRANINGNMRALFDDMVKARRLSTTQVDLGGLPQVPEGDRKPVGDIGVQILELRAANLALLEQIENVKSYPEKIRIEQQRVGKIARARRGNGAAVGALQVAMGFANSMSISFGRGPPTLNFHPGSIVSGFASAEITQLETDLQITIDDANSDAIIKNLLLEQRRAYDGIRQAENRVLQAQAVLDNMLVRTSGLLEDWAKSRQGAADVYFRYPMFRVERDQAIVRADQSFQRAREACYFAAKGLQYEWVEAYSNPIASFGSASGESLPVGYDQFARIDSVFSARDTLQLKDFLGALYQWHTRLSTNGRRGSPRQQKRFTKLISLRQDLWGYNDRLKGNDQSKEEIREKNISLFRQRIQKHLKRDDRGRITDLAFEFSTEIDSNRMFATDEWNQKILRMGIGLRGVDLGDTNPAVQITQGGVASLRKFPPKFNVVERLSLSGLGTDSLRQVFNRPAEQRTYRKITKVLLNPSREDYTDNEEKNMDGGLAELSVAADRWTFHLDMADPANKDFPVRNLTDILFIFRYTFNHPPTALGDALQREQAKLSNVSRR
jgi:hypothetical protein